MDIEQALQGLRELAGQQQAQSRRTDFPMAQPVVYPVCSSGLQVRAPAAQLQTDFSVVSNLSSLARNVRWSM